MRRRRDRRCRDGRHGRGGRSGRQAPPRSCLARPRASRRTARDSARLRSGSACAGTCRRDCRCSCWLRRMAKAMRSASRSSRVVGKGGERRRRSRHCMRSVMSRDDGAEQVLLVAVMVVDGLPRDAGLGGDQIDVGAAKAFAAEHIGRSVDDRQRAWRHGSARTVELSASELSVSHQKEDNAD